MFKNVASLFINSFLAIFVGTRDVTEISLSSADDVELLTKLFFCQELNVSLHDTYLYPSTLKRILGTFNLIKTYHKDNSPETFTVAFRIEF